MSIKVFEKISIGFGNNKGDTTLVLLQQRAQKITRVDIKSQFGPNPKVFIKPIPQINLAPFTQMIYQKRDKQTLQYLLRGNLIKGNQTQQLQEIKRKAQQNLQQLKGQQQFLKSCDYNLQTDFIVSRTGCSQKQAKKYLQNYKTSKKAIQMINEHRGKVDEVAKKYGCTKEASKDILQASDYNMNLLG